MEPSTRKLVETLFPQLVLHQELKNIMYFWHKWGSLLSWLFALFGFVLSLLEQSAIFMILCQVTGMILVGVSNYIFSPSLDESIHAMETEDKIRTSTPSDKELKFNLTFSEKMHITQNIRSISCVLTCYALMTLIGLLIAQIRTFMQLGATSN